jgi:hypothetical protein
MLNKLKSYSQNNHTHKTFSAMRYFALLSASFCLILVAGCDQSPQGGSSEADETTVLEKKNEAKPNNPNPATRFVRVETGGYVKAGSGPGKRVVAYSLQETDNPTDHEMYYEHMAASTGDKGTVKKICCSPELRVETKSAPRSSGTYDCGGYASHKAEQGSITDTSQGVDQCSV